MLTRALSLMPSQFSRPRAIRAATVSATATESGPAGGPRRSGSPVDHPRPAQLVPYPEDVAPDVVQHPADVTVLDLQVDGRGQVEIGAVQLRHGHPYLVGLGLGRASTLLPVPDLE